MMTRLMDNLILYILLLKQELYRTSLCWMLILPLQTFLVVLMSIQANLNNSSSNFISSSLLKIWQQMNSEIVTRFFIIFCSCLIVIWVLLATLFILLKQPMHKLDIYHQFANKLITVSSLLLIVLEFALFNLFILVRNAIFNFYTYSHPIQLENNLAFFIPACFIAIIVVSFINYRIRLMGAFYLIFFIFQGISINFHLVNLVIGFAICLYAIYADEQTQFLLIQQRNIRKILHLLLAFFFLWNFVISIDNKDTDQLESYLPYVYLLVFFISSLTIGIVKFTCKVNKKQPLVIQLCQCLHKIKNNEQDNFSKLMAQEIQNEYMKTNSKFRQLNSIQWKMEEKSESVSYWEDERWKTLINSMIQKQMQKEFSLNSSINMIKCRLITKDQKIFQIMDALKDLISKQKQLGLYEKYQILKISLKIKKACFTKIESEEFPVVQILRQVDRLNEKFYLNASKLVRNVYVFWSMVFSKKLEESDLINFNDLQVIDSQNMCTQALIENIQQQIKSLRETVVEIQKLSVAQQQKKILEQVMRICTGLSQGEKSYTKMQNEIDEGVRTNKDYFQCIEIIDNKISYISLKLANELGYKKNQIIGQNLSSLIPKQYQQTIKNKVKTIQKQSYTFEYYTPLKCSNSTVILKQLKLYLQIDYKYGYRVILHCLNSSYKNQQPFIMYNILSNCVQYFNQAFFVGYEFQSVTSKNKENEKNKEKKCEYKILNHLSDKDIQSKLSESGADVQYNCKMFIPKPMEKIFVNFQNVRVSLIQRNLNYLILRVVKGHRLKSVAGGFGNANHHSHQSSNISFSLSNPSSLSYSMGKMKQRIDDENATYCKIQNPYQLRINRKKKQLLDTSKLSLRFIAILIIFVATFFFLLQSISFLIISFKVNDEMQSEHENTLSQFQQYTLLMQAYQSYFEQTIVNLQKQKLQQMNIDVGRILKQNREKIETNINSFQQIYLQNLLIPQHAPIPYKIRFKNFDIKTDTSKTNLFDYSQNLLQYENNDSLQFLINNYRTFGQLIVQTCDISGHSQQNVVMYQNVFYIVSGAAFLVILVGIGVGVGIGRKIGGVCADVQFVFQLIELQYLQKMFKQLKYINEKLLKNKEQQSSRNLQQARGMPIRQKSISMIDSIIQPSENDEQKQIMIQQHFAEAAAQNESNEKYLKNKDKRKKTQSYWNLIFFVVLTSVIVIVQAFYLYSSIQKSSLALDYALQGRKMAQNIIHQVLQTQYQITLRKLLKDTTQAYDLNLFSVKLTINDKKLPVEQFKQFIQSIFDKNSGNLCQTLRNQTRITYTKSVCNKIGGGIFGYGISKTIEYLNQILVYSIKKSEWIAPSRYSTLLRSQQIVFSQQMILAINKQNEEEFERYYQKFNTKVKQSAIQIFLLGCGLSLLLVIVNIYTRRHIYSMGKIAVGYFLIIPQKVLLQSEILDYIRKNDILNRISSI